MDICLYRRFTHVWHNSRTEEVILVYGNKENPEMSISLTEEFILVRDSEFDYKEILFPFSWTPYTPSIADKPLLNIDAVSDVSAVEW
jgi:hypothetical protein